MPQFTPKSLARVLVQVEREVLVEAVEIAQLEQFFTSFELRAIRELGEVFNFFANLGTFGLDNIIEEAAEVKADLGLGRETVLSPGAHAVLNFLINAAQNWGTLFLELTGLDELLQTLDQAILELPFPEEIDVSSVIVVLIEVVEKLERALGILRGDITGGPTAFNVVEDAIILTRTALRDLRG